MTSTSARPIKRPLFVCPFCGYGDIDELALCVVTHRVTAWSASGEAEEFGEPEVDWESDMPYDALRGSRGTALKSTFECRRCREQFERPKASGESRSDSPLR
jgi:hypothetical protein